MRLRIAAWGAGAVIAAVLLGALAHSLDHPMGPTPSSVSMLGRRAPDFTLRTLTGGTVRLSDFQGRPVVLNFWASWCVGCHQEAPVLARQARSGVGAVQFLGIDIQDSATAAQAYEAQVRDPYPVGTVVSGDMSTYGVNAPPQTFFVNSEGKIVAHFIGPLDGPTLDLYMSRIR